MKTDCASSFLNKTPLDIQTIQVDIEKTNSRILTIYKYLKISFFREKYNFIKAACQIFICHFLPKGFLTCYSKYMISKYQVYLPVKISFFSYIIYLKKVLLFFVCFFFHLTLFFIHTNFISNCWNYESERRIINIDKDLPVASHLKILLELYVTLVIVYWPWQEHLHEGFASVLRACSNSHMQRSGMYWN